MDGLGFCLPRDVPAVIISSENEDFVRRSGCQYVAYGKYLRLYWTFAMSP